MCCLLRRRLSRRPDRVRHDAIRSPGHAIDSGFGLCRSRHTRLAGGIEGPFGMTGIDGDRGADGPLRIVNHPLGTLHHPMGPGRPAVDQRFGNLRARDPGFLGGVEGGGDGLGGLVDGAVGRVGWLGDDGDPAPDVAGLGEPGRRQHRQLPDRERPLDLTRHGEDDVGDRAPAQALEQVPEPAPLFSEVQV